MDYGKGSRFRVKVKRFGAHTNPARCSSGCRVWTKGEVYRV
jgi:hypothetical protein